jgi:hypothetical protein
LIRDESIDFESDLIGAVISKSVVEEDHIRVLCEEFEINDDVNLVSLLKSIIQE